ncbi:MAG: metallophosphoesterase family protein [Caldisericia bacterium]
MKKILFFTDTHLQEIPISSRKDNYLESIIKKIEEIKDIANNENVDYVLFGGDFFSKPSPSDEVIIKLIQILKKFNSRPIITILGNHDIEGRNPDTYNRKAVKILEEAHLVKVLKDKETYPPFDTEIEIQGINYKNGVDNDPNLLKVEKKRKGLVLIQMVHSYVLPFKTYFQTISIEELSKITEADIILIGHYHDGFGERKVNDKIFICPGSIARDSINQFNRIPQVVLIKIDGSKIETQFIKLKNVLKKEEIELKEIKEIENFIFQDFFQSLQGKNIESFEPEKIIDEILKDENVDQEIKDEVLKRYEEAREKYSRKS